MRESPNLEYKFKGGKLGLRNINIHEESGKLIGIMGGSGAGKSTLLNVLNSNEVPSGGAVLINGINIHTQKHEIEGVIGHVSQDDLLIEELTVFQNLFYNAKLCFGNLADDKIAGMVMETLTDLGLEIPAKQIGQVHGVIHYRTAPGQLLIGKPRAVNFWNLAVIDAVYAQHVSKLSLLEHGTYHLGRRSEAHRERGHKVHTIFCADRLHRVGISKIGFDGLLT